MGDPRFVVQAALLEPERYLVRSEQLVPNDDEGNHGVLALNQALLGHERYLLRYFFEVYLLIFFVSFQENVQLRQTLVLVVSANWIRVELDVFMSLASSLLKRLRRNERMYQLKN